MKDEFDRIMSEEEILPSSGFATSVMDAVRREALAPPPIPFPWKRALPGMIFAGATLAVVLVMCAIQLIEAASSAPSLQPVSTLQLLRQYQVHWISLALAIVLVMRKAPSFLGLRGS